MNYEELSTDGDRLRWFRDQADLTQGELGRRAGCSQPSVSQYETGASEPDRHVKRRIAEALGVHPSVIWHNTNSVRRAA